MAIHVKRLPLYVALAASMLSGCAAPTRVEQPASLESTIAQEQDIQKAARAFKEYARKGCMDDFEKRILSDAAKKAGYESYQKAMEDKLFVDDFLNSLQRWSPVPPY